MDATQIAIMTAMQTSSVREPSVDRRELSKALKHLRRSGLESIKITLSAEQIASLRDALDSGKEFNLVINLK